MEGLQASFYFVETIYDADLFAIVTLTEIYEDT